MFHCIRVVRRCFLRTCFCIWALPLRKATGPGRPPRAIRLALWAARFPGLAPTPSVVNLEEGRADRMIVLVRLGHIYMFGIDLGEVIDW
jgi:hypothetical protein